MWYVQRKGVRFTYLSVVMIKDYCRKQHWSGLSPKAKLFHLVLCQRKSSVPFTNKQKRAIKLMPSLCTFRETILYVMRPGSFKIDFFPQLKRWPIWITGNRGMEVKQRFLFGVVQLILASRISILEANSSASFWRARFPCQETAVVTQTGLQIRTYPVWISPTVV